MAIAHVCLSCGWDLARVRPAREPHYGLPLIRCPRCSHAAVRSRHPLWRHWRAVRRLDWTLSVLVTQCACIIAFTALTLLAIPAILTAWPRLRAGASSPEMEFGLLAIFVVLAPLTGAWLTAGFAHLRAWKVWLGWIGFIGAGVAIMSCELAIEGGVHTLAPRANDAAAFPGRLQQAMMHVFVPGLAALAAMMLCALAGIPLGRALLWLAAAARRSLWRRRRKRARLARAV